ncbi:MAG: alpha/beta fold hydrolase [Thermoleophilaceae bacterium]|nr:alpha/beta fold hydrolase [Thermoleophilaceae bacterium]
MTGDIRYARNGDVSLAYQVLGEGPLDVVLVSGFVSNQEVMWDDPMAARTPERISAFARLILYDKRDQGLSDRFGRPPTLEESMDDLRAVMDAAGSERAALYGISEGGPMCQLFAATFPERVTALVLYGTYARMIEGDGYDIGVPDATLATFGEILVRDWGSPVGLHMFAPSVADDQRFRDYWARLLRSGSSPRSAAALMDLYRQIDTRSVLASISAPTLVMHRAGDRAAPVAFGRYLAENIPGARYVELDGVDHLPMVDSEEILDELEEFLTGSRLDHEPDRVLATVMFTDIVASTERAAELGDSRWRDLIETHDRLVRRQLDRHRGRAVKTLGDGFLATFDGPARAIRCAQAIREGVRSLGIEIRAGLHTGELEVRGDDVAGMAVNIGARVGAKAEPGEVLVSSTVTDLVVGSGLEFRERGTHELKGVPGEWRLYAVAD